MPLREMDEAQRNTQFFALIGKKLGHSLSVPIHRYFFEEMGLNAAYRLTEIPEDSVSEAVRAFELLGFRGFNVTIPYKQVIMPFLRSVDDFAARVGAVNTICLKEDGAHGYNTDVRGFLAMLRRMGADVSGGRAVILGGSGGAAKAAIEALRASGAREILLVTRNPEGRSSEAPDVRWMGYAELMDVRGEIIVNCTPVGMYPNGGETPVPREVIRHFSAAADMVYNPLETVFVRLAREAGIPAENGLYMLVAQAIAAEEIWQDEVYPPELTEKIYARLERALMGGEMP